MRYYSFGQRECVSLEFGPGFLANQILRLFSPEHSYMIALTANEAQKKEGVVRISLTSNDFTACKPMLFFSADFSRLLLCHNDNVPDLDALIARNIGSQDYGFALNMPPDQLSPFSLSNRLKKGGARFASAYREEGVAYDNPIFSIRVEIILNAEGNLQQLSFTASRHETHFEVTFDIDELRTNPEQSFQAYVDSKIKRYKKDPTPEEELTALRTVLTVFDKAMPKYLDDCWFLSKKTIEAANGTHLHICLHQLTEKIIRAEQRGMHVFKPAARNALITAFTELGISAEWVTDVLETKIKPNLGREYSQYPPRQLAIDLMQEIARIEAEKAARDQAAPAALQR